MARAVIFEPDAWKDFNNWLSDSADLTTAKRICALLKDIQRTPFSGIGKPEGLKHKHAGYWSRRINKIDRLVYKITEDAIVIISCRHHYAR